MVASSISSSLAQYCVLRSEQCLDKRSLSVLVNTLPIS